VNPNKRSIEELVKKIGVRRMETRIATFQRLKLLAKHFHCSSQQEQHIHAAIGWLKIMHHQPSRGHLSAGSGCGIEAGRCEPQAASHNNLGTAENDLANAEGEHNISSYPNTATSSSLISHILNFVALLTRTTLRITIHAIRSLGETIWKRLWRSARFQSAVVNCLERFECVAHSLNVMAKSHKATLGDDVRTGDREMISKHR
jgi:hypothetical protein